MAITKKDVRFWFVATARRSLSPRIIKAEKRRKAVVSVGIGALVYLVLHVALVAASEFSLFLRDPCYADKELKLSRLEKSLPAGSPMVLFLGTSRVGNGFDAGQAQATLTAASGRPLAAFNWGIPGSGPVYNLVHLRRILRDGHRPSLLMLEVFAASFATTPRERGTYELQNLEGINLEWSELHSIGDYDVPTERLREQRQSVLISPWSALRFRIMGRIRPTMLPYYLRYDWSRMPDINGWCPVVAETISEETREAGVKRTRDEFGDILANATLNEGSVRAFRDMLAIARDAGVPVAVVRMPEGTNLRNLHPPAMAAKFDRLLKGLSVEYGFQIYDTREWITDDAFMDGNHLMRRGAEMFTQRLVRESLEPFFKSTYGSSR